MMRLTSLFFGATILLGAACGNAADEATDNTPATTAQQHESDPPPANIEIDSVTAATHARLMELAQEQDLAERPMGEVIQTFAEALIGYPYVEHMLDQDEEETLVVSLAGFDCVLFNEAVIALAQAARARAYDVETFARNIESLRYRNGEMMDYCSRLHYFSDWLRDNAARGNIALVTDDLRAAQSFNKRIDFMTEHRDVYRRLADDEQFACIREVQNDLNQVSFRYVPQERITEVYDQLQPGDILALTTNVDGLDIAHTGFVYRHPNGGVGFIHASTTGEVRIDRDLATYVRGIRIQNGMMVARAQDKPARQ